MNELQHVEFHGDLIDTFVGIDGTPWVSLNRLCENLGVDAHGQRAKLKEKPWANMTIMPTTATDGKRRDTTMIDLDTIPGFLFCVDVNRVAPRAKQKLTLYQCEASKVLGEHFKQAFAKHMQLREPAAKVEPVALPAPPLSTVAPPALPPAPPQQVLILSDRESRELLELDSENTPLETMAQMRKEVRRLKLMVERQAVVNKTLVSRVSQAKQAALKAESVSSRVMDHIEKFRVEFRISLSQLPDLHSEKPQAQNPPEKRWTIGDRAYRLGYHEWKGKWLAEEITAKIQQIANNLIENVLGSYPMVVSSKHPRGYILQQFVYMKHHLPALDWAIGQVWEEMKNQQDAEIDERKETEQQKAFIAKQLKDLENSSL